MAKLEAHQKRLAEIDDQIQRIDNEIVLLAAERRANPASSAAAMAVTARARRQQYLEERDEVAGDVAAIQALERSAARVEQRAHARKTLQAALDTADHRAKLAASLDKAGKAFLAALDELVSLGNATQAAVCESAQLATPFHTHLLGDPWHNGLLEQRRRFVENAAPHAGGFTGPDMKHAMAHFISKLLDRVENPHGVAILAGGWTFDPEQAAPFFADAAQRAHGRLEHNSHRIEHCLKEPT